MAAIRLGPRDSDPRLGSESCVCATRIREAPRRAQYPLNALFAASARHLNFSNVSEIRHVIAAATAVAPRSVSRRRPLIRV